MTGSKRLRDSRMELLRIFAAFLILAHHAIQHGGEQVNSLIQSSFSVNQLWSTLIGSWGQLGVTVFIIISSWFLVDIRGGYGVRISKAIDIFCESWLYSLIILVLTLLLGYNVPKEIILNALLTPVYPFGYWFVTAFIMFYLSIPVLRIVVTNITDKQLAYIVVIGGIIIPIYNFIYEGMSGIVSYFYYVFFFTSYCKRKKNNFVEQHCIAVFFITTLIIVVLTELFAVIFDTNLGRMLMSKVTKLNDSRNVIILLQGFSLFYMFLRMPPFHNKTINEIAKTALGTYLITENIVIRGASASEESILWNQLFSFSEAFHTKYFILYSAISILLVLIVAVLIDYCRVLLKKKTFIRLKFVEKMDQWGVDCFQLSNNSSIMSQDIENQR